jgi:hypothetical protein
VVGWACMGVFWTSGLAASALAESERGRLAQGATVQLNCPDLALERVPGGPQRLLRAGGELEVVASSDTGLLVQGAAGHRGWVPQSCLAAPIEVVPLQPVLENQPPRRGPAVVLHWTPDGEEGDALVDEAVALSRARPDLRVELVAHGAAGDVLAALPHPSPLSRWHDATGQLTPAAALPVVEFWAPDGERRELKLDEGRWPSEAISSVAPAPPPERYSLDTMSDIERVTNGAMQRPFLSAACEDAAVEMATGKDARSGRYVRWMAALVHERTLHDIVLWDFATLGMASVREDAAVQCILDTVSPFVALRGAAEPVFTTTHVHAATPLEVGLDQLQSLAETRSLRFMLIHLGEPSLDEALVRGDSAVPTRELQLSPSAAQLTAWTQTLGLPSAGGSLLVTY